MRIDRTARNLHRDTFSVQSKGLVNTAAPPIVLEIQKVHGNEAVLQFLIDEYDSTMEAFIEIRSPDPDIIWAYQRIVSEDLVASVCLADVDNPEYVIECFRHYVNIGRKDRRTVGRLDRKSIGTL